MGCFTILNPQYKNCGQGRRVNAKEVINLLVKAGWQHTSTRGSHYKMQKEGYRSVPVPVHGNRDLGVGLLKAIEKQTGVTLIKRD